MTNAIRLRANVTVVWHRLVCLLCSICSRFPDIIVLLYFTVCVCHVELINLLRLLRISLLFVGNITIHYAIIVIMGGQYDGVFPSGSLLTKKYSSQLSRVDRKSLPIFFIWHARVLFFMANKLCCCCCLLTQKASSSTTAYEESPFYVALSREQDRYFLWPVFLSFFVTLSVRATIVKLSFHNRSATGLES